MASTQGHATGSWPCQLRRLVVLDDPAAELVDRGPLCRVAPRDRRFGRAGDLVHERLAIDVLQAALQHQGASFDDHALDVRGLRARQQELPDVDLAHGERCAESSQVEHDDIAAPARLEPADRRRGADDPGASVPCEPEGLGREQSRVPGLSVHALQDVREPHFREHVVVVREAHVVEPEGDAHARRHEPAQRCHAGCETQVRGGVVHDRGSGAGQQVDVGVAQPDAVGDGAAVAQHADRGQPLQLAASGEGISPGALQRALERVQMDAGTRRGGRRGDRLGERVAGPLRRHDRELGAQERIAGELAHECLDRLDVRLGGHARARDAAAPAPAARPGGRR